MWSSRMVLVMKSMYPMSLYHSARRLMMKVTNNSCQMGLPVPLASEGRKLEVARLPSLPSCRGKGAGAGKTGLGWG
jgi:hypothetical protein